MAFVEYLRVRRMLLRFLVILLGFLAIAQLNALRDHRWHGFIQIDGTDKNIPFWTFITISALLAAIGSTVLGTNLQRERQHRALSWTLPISRTRSAAIIIGVDIAGLVVTYLLALTFFTLPMLTSVGSKAVVFTGIEPAVLLYGFAMSVLWYSLIQASTAWTSSHGGTVAGLSWPLFLVAGGLMAAKHLPPAIHAAVDLFNNINPFAYLLRLFSRFGPHTLASLPLTDVLQLTLIMFGIAIVALAVAVAGWRHTAA